MHYQGPDFKPSCATRIEEDRTHQRAAMEYHSPFALPEDAGSDVQRRDVEIRLVATELHQFPGESVAVRFRQRRAQQLECRTEEVRAHHRAQISNVISILFLKSLPKDIVVQ